MPLSPAVALLDEVRYGGLAGQPCAFEVDIKDLIPLPFVDLMEQGTVGENPRVGHDDINPAELGNAGVEHLPQGGEVAHIRSCREDPAVERLHPGDRPCQVVLGGGRVERGAGGDLPEDVDGDDVRPLTSQRHSMTASLTPGRPGYEGDLSFHPACHVPPRPAPSVAGVVVSSRSVASTKS
jgi:hypothetical protein